MNSKITSNVFYYWLDPIRALAAILVLLVHTRSVLFVTYENLVPDSQNTWTAVFYALCSLGAFSVCLFYILSGFLVGGKTIDRALKGPISPQRFFSDRLFRIGVPLTGALVLICVVNIVIGLGIEWDQLFAQYLGLQCILTADYGGVFWTLPYEIWFYAIILAFILICNRSKHILIGALIFSLSLIVFCNLLPQFLYIIVCGIFCYFVKDYRFNDMTKRALWVLSVISFLIYFASHLHYLSVLIGVGDWGNKLQTPSQIILFTLIALLLSQYVSKSPISKVGIFINVIGKKLAAISYSLFLTHYQILKIWKAYMPQFDAVNIRSMIYFIFVCLICILIAYLFYYIFERNTRKVQTFVENKLLKSH